MALPVVLVVAAVLPPATAVLRLQQAKETLAVTPIVAGGQHMQEVAVAVRVLPVVMRWGLPRWLVALVAQELLHL
jgi:hypothetical protein